MAKVYLKPKGKLVVRDPAEGGAELPPAGKWVELDAYWRRRLKDNSVEKSEPPTKTKKSLKGSKE